MQPKPHRLGDTPEADIVEIEGYIRASSSYAQRAAWEKKLAAVKARQPSKPAKGD